MKDVYPPGPVHSSMFNRGWLFKQIYQILDWQITWKPFTLLEQPNPYANTTVGVTLMAIVYGA